MKKLLLSICGLSLVLAAAFSVARAQEDAPYLSGFQSRVRTGPVIPTPVGPALQAPAPAPPRAAWTERRPAAYGLPTIAPPVSQAAVTAWLAGASGIPGIQLLQPPTLSGVEFMTAGALRQKFGVGTLLDKYASAAPVVDVQLTGRFTADDPANVQTASELILDATTGNLLTVRLK